MNITAVDTFGNSSANGQEQGFYLNLIGQGVIVPTICVIGICLNIITFIVLMDKTLKQSSYTYLTSLAVADFFSLLLFGTNGFSRGHFPTSTEGSIYERFVYFPFALITTNASVFMIVSVTVERFVFLYRPLKAKFWCTQKSARKTVAILWILSVVMNIPRFFVFTMTDDGKLNYTTFGKSKYYTVISWLYFFTFALGCGIILIVFNILLIKGIRVTNERRKTLHNNKNVHERREDVRLTRTLVSVIFLYLIGELPSCIFSRMVFSAILGNKNQDVMDELWYKICLCVATIFVVLQHSLNFVFYCVFNKRFYCILKKKCDCLYTKKYSAKDEMSNLDDSCTREQFLMNENGKT